MDRPRRAGDPKVVTFVTIGEDNVDGDFLADPSLRARAGAHVRLRFERRGTISVDHGRIGTRGQGLGLDGNHTDEALVVTAF